GWAGSWPLISSLMFLALTPAYTPTPSSATPAAPMPMPTLRTVELPCASGGGGGGGGAVTSAGLGGAHGLSSSPCAGPSVACSCLAWLVAYTALVPPGSLS